jgi:diacylglycerol kinase family enzyme
VRAAGATIDEHGDGTLALLGGGTWREARRVERVRPLRAAGGTSVPVRIDVIVNTNARLYRTRPGVVGGVREACASRAEVFVTATMADLERAVATIADRGSDLVVLSGGDGSFMAGVTALSRAFGDRELPRVALMAGGTVATVARNWGKISDPVDFVRALLRDPEALEPTPRPTLRVRERLGESVAERVGFIFGTGLVARFFDVYYADGARGYGGAARIVARIFVESFYGGAYARRVLDPLPCRIEVDGRTLEPPAWSLVCAAVVKNLGIHMMVNYRAGEDPSRVHLVASPLSSRALGPRAPLVLAGKSIGGRGHFDDLVRAFTVRFDPSGPYVLDGEVLRAAEVTVSAGPVLRVVSPIVAPR